MSQPTPIRHYDVAARSTDVFGRVQCDVRQHHFIVDGPVQNGCPGEEITPPESFLSGVAACGVELVQVIAKEQGIAVGAVGVSLQGKLDRSKQKLADVTVLNEVHMTFTVGGTDAGTAAQLVEGFKRR
jgi:uncharacterized OsmC-like protein